MGRPDRRGVGGTMNVARPGERGVSLPEVMAAVVIVAILAAVARPMFGRYIRRARSSEAAQSLERVGAGAKAYFETVQGDTNGRPYPRQFPATVAVTPAAACCSGTGGWCPANLNNWESNATWHALRFSISMQHYYQYSFTSSGQDTAAAFTADAIGNLDCDATTATWRMAASVDANTYRPEFLGRPRVTTGPNDEIE